MVCVRPTLERPQPCMLQSTRSARGSGDRLERSFSTAQTGKQWARPMQAAELTPLRRLYKHSRLRKFVRRRRNAMFYHLTRLALLPPRAVSLPRALADIARAAYRSAARCFIVLAKLDEIRAHFDDYVSVEGWQHVDEVLALGRGGIVITGHIGNWELLAAYVARRGISVAASA